MTEKKIGVVYNGQFGGFSLSRIGVLRARELSGDPNWGGPCIVGDVYEGGAPVDMDFGYLDNIPRHDPVLVAVVRELGPAASNRHSDLQIAELPVGSRYRIDEYDGNEAVMTVDDYNWITLPDTE